MRHHDPNGNNGGIMITPQYMYAGRGLRAIDGDTLEVAIDAGFHVTVTHHVRLSRINCTERTSKILSERLLAEEAKLWSQGVTVNRPLVLETRKDDAFGRFLAEVWYTNDQGVQVNLNDELMARGLAVPYVRK
jgi:micrococcal nuclease